MGFIAYYTEGKFKTEFFGRQLLKKLADGGWGGGS